MLKKTYTITEAMPFLGVGRTTITYWINLGIIEAKKEKGKWIIDGQSMKEWQEFQGSGFKTADENMKKRFEAATVNFHNLQKERHEKIMKKATIRKV